MSYNGYKNYETWNINLWVQNEEPAYRCMLENRPYTTEKALRIAMEMYPNGTPDMDGPEDYDKVEWSHIAEVWNEE